MAAKKAGLERRLLQIENELKVLQRQFPDIKKKAKHAILGATKKRNAKKIDEIRAGLGSK